MVDNDLYVISEEFSKWGEGKRRIDLFAVDCNANLVVPTQTTNLWSAKEAAGYRHARWLEFWAKAFGISISALISVRKFHPDSVYS